MSTLAVKAKQAADIAALKHAIELVKAGGKVELLHVNKNNRASRRKAKSK